MKCEKVRELISEYIDGELSPQINKKVEEHLENCPSCSTLVNTLKATVLLSHEVEDWKMFPQNIFNNLHDILEKELQFFTDIPRITINEAGEARLPHYGGSMSANIIEQKNTLILIMELTGVKKENINIVVSTKSIEISGIREEPVSGAYYLNEIVYGEFYREIELPYTIIPEKTKSSFKNGILKVKMIKA